MHSIPRYQRPYMKMVVELLSAACECITTLLAYCLIAAPQHSERYGGVMEALMLLSLGMQVIAQFGAYFDVILAYMDMAVRYLGFRAAEKKAEAEAEAEAANATAAAADAADADAEAGMCAAAAAAEAGALMAASVSRPSRQPSARPPIRHLSGDQTSQQHRHRFGVVTTFESKVRRCRLNRCNPY